MKLNNLTSEERKARHKEQTRLWRIENHVQVKETLRKWRAEKPDKVLENNLRSHYGLSLAEFIKLAVEQKACCKICGTQGKLCVDHDHTTGKVRSLLCKNCNSAIGLLQDSPVVAQKAVAYLSEAHCSV